jgi:hypothetical protein
MLLFWIETSLPAEISLRFVRKSSLAFEILVGPAVPTEVVVVVIGAEVSVYTPPAGIVAVE